MKSIPFVETTKLFCQWAESENHDLLTARQLLLALMQGIPSLPDTPVQQSDKEYPTQSYNDWEKVHKHLSDLPLQYYQEISSPRDLDDTAPVVGDLCDDIADIYGELSHGMLALNSGDDTYALSHWRQSYFQHWGSHAASALRAIDDFYRSTPPPLTPS